MSEGRAAAMGPIVLRQLEELCGYPVRVTVLDSQSHERLYRMPGVLRRVEDGELLVETAGPVGALPEEAPVTFEVLREGSLFWCHTNLGTGADAQSLRLQVPEAMQVAQRRRYPRVDLELPVHVEIDNGDDILTAILRDLSAGGASLLLSDAVPEGQRVRVMFDLGTGFFFRDLEAEVVRCTTAQGQYVVALKFFCQAEQEADLAAWVSRQLKG